MKKRILIVVMIFLAVWPVPHVFAQQEGVVLFGRLSVNMFGERELHDPVEGVHVLIGDILDDYDNQLVFVTGETLSGQGAKKFIVFTIQIIGDDESGAALKPSRLY